MDVAIFLASSSSSSCVTEEKAAPPSGRENIALWKNALMTTNTLYGHKFVDPYVLVEHLI